MDTCVLKKIYRSYIAWLEQRSQKTRLRKQWVGEWLEVLFGDIAKLINKTVLTKEQKAEIQEYWKNVYGKKISLRWHRKYYAFNGKLDKRYFPEILYTTRLEPKLNPDKIAKILQDKNLIESLFARILCENNDIVIPKTICGCSGGYFFDNDRNPVSYEAMIEKLREFKSFCGNKFRKRCSYIGFTL